MAEALVEEYRDMREEFIEIPPHVKSVMTPSRCTYAVTLLHDKTPAITNTKLSIKYFSP